MSKVRVIHLDGGGWAVIKPPEHVAEHGCVPEYVVLEWRTALRLAIAFVEEPGACVDWTLPARLASAQRRPIYSLGYEIPAELLQRYDVPGWGNYTDACQVCGHGITRHLMGCCDVQVLGTRTCGCTRRS